MEFYKTQGIVRLPGGTVIWLGDEQFAARSHVLVDHGDGAYVAQSGLEFKAGEVIGLLSVPPTLRDQLVLVETDDPKGDEGDEGDEGADGYEGDGGGESNDGAVSVAKKIKRK